MSKDESFLRPCVNDKCARPASPGEPLCETCALERSLYRREERGGSREVRERFSAVLGPGTLDRIAVRPD